MLLIDKKKRRTFQVLKAARRWAPSRVTQSPEQHKEKGKKFPCEIWPWHWLTLLVENFLFTESLVKIFSNPRKEHQMAYKLPKKNLIKNQKQRD